mmetsp:Transcript_5215/g.9927  ORF Transcript_5215/g.9927 Transcript_5215/m.9927 type:complete len:325 (+) Transcript_5215:215-1189(+)|eukprot:CAMPEP_0114264422 /NCGR_PEP_ID=MMETSP0058-20121206/23191_1 /TAXON_ID=36894 /ORGANISM="Pyramimonas parkeae, CCMP726" /LENGTH=324 /DNA_ID=CAMNT_0001381081 /DNA_START=208 /DNA_END=1182 /DNA_ORIENTATION=+
MEWEKVQQLDSDVHEGDACGCSCTCDVVDAQNAKPHCEGTIGPESEPFKSQGHEDSAPLSLARRLFLAHQMAGRPRPNHKEMSESFAFFTKTEKSLMTREKEVVIDVCGGHGMIAMLFLVFRKAKTAIVLDKEPRESLNVMWKAWQDFLPHRGSLQVELGDFRRTLPEALTKFEANKVVVVACHACSHLSDEVLQMCSHAHVDFAVMPCCHRDQARDVDRGQIKHAADECNISLGLAMDLVRMGRMQALGYFMRFRTVDAKISPHNRILIGVAGGRDVGAFGGLGDHRKDSGTSNRDRKNRAKAASDVLKVSSTNVGGSCMGQT